jgi:hypothetical protein
MVVSLMLAVPAISVSRRLEWLVTRGDGAWLVLADLPVSILSIPFIASGMAESSPGAVVVAAMYVLLGLAYAYLEANAAFTVPFFDYRKAVGFQDSGGEETSVTAFGIEQQHEYAYRRLRDQIEVLYMLRNEHAPEQLDEFAIDLCRDSSPNQIVVAVVPSKSTLLEMLQDVDAKTENFTRQSKASHLHWFGVRDVLLVPNLNWDIRHRFVELEGSDKPFLNKGFTSYHIAKAMQMIRFRLDRSGAELASEVQMICRPMATRDVQHQVRQDLPAVHVLDQFRGSTSSATQAVGPTGQIRPASASCRRPSPASDERPPDWSSPPTVRCPRRSSPACPAC